MQQKNRKTTKKICIFPTKGGDASQLLTPPPPLPPPPSPSPPLQVFNLFNCRSVRDEWNIFEGFGNSVIAQFILGIIVSFQVLIVQFGGSLMQTAPLSLDQWRACVMIGGLSIPVGYLLKLIPASLIQLGAIAPQSSGLSISAGRIIGGNGRGGASIEPSVQSASPEVDTEDDAPTPGRTKSLRKRTARAN